MKTRIIHTKIWKDNWFSSLPKNSKLLFLYLVSNEDVNMIGIYEANDMEMKLWLGFNDKELQEAKEFLRAKVIFKNGWVKILNHDKYNSYGNGEKQKSALEKEKKIVPQYLYDTSIDTSMDTSAILDINHKSENIKQKKGGVGGKVDHVKIIKEISSDAIQEISEKYHVPVTFVESKRDDMLNWHEQDPARNVKKNWVATLRVWTKKDAVSIAQNQARTSNKFKVARI
ncbi:MAG: hypothetical protein MOGMAGMI_01835 [Candidatus Omnitrophica bacterium]|nr:hypothetical protein [Candidatus Omnitrophota bacterium]